MSPQFRVVWSNKKEEKKTIWFNYLDDAERMAESIRAGGDKVKTIEMKKEEK